MGKLTAIILGSIAITFASYSILSFSYSPIIDWLGPYYGSKLNLVAGMVYLMWASPLSNTMLIAVWVIIGVIVGLSARRGLRAWGSASLLFTITTACLSLIVISMLGISVLNYSSFNSSYMLSLFESSIAFMPYGVNISTIVAEPVLHSFAVALLPAVSGNSGFSVSDIIPVFSRFAFHEIENYLIFAITAIIVGSIAGRSLKRKVNKTTVAAVLVVLIAIIMLSMAYSPAPVNTSNYMAASSGNNSINEMSYFSINGNSIEVNHGDYDLNTSSNQGALSLITPDGNLYNTYMLESNNISGIWKNNNGLILGSAVINDNMSSLITNSFKINYNGIENIMPDNMIILVYKNPDSVAAKNTANAIGNKLGIKTEMVLNINNITLAGNAVSLYIFSTNHSISPSSFMNSFASSYSSSIENMFFSTEKNYTDNSYMLISGYINNSMVNSIDNSINLPAGYIQFTSGVFEYKNMFHSSSDNHTFNLSTLMKYYSNISLSKSGFSFAGIGYNNGTGSLLNPASYIYNIYTNNKTIAEELPFNTSNSEFTNGNNFSPYAVSVTYNNVFPASTNYSTQVTHINSDTVEIKVIFKNNDNTTIKNLNISQSEFYNHYIKYNAMSYVNGTYHVNNKTLAPGISTEFSYTLKLNGDGTYVIPYTNISYTFQNKSFNLTTNATYINQKNTGYAVAMNNIAGNIVKQYVPELGLSIHTFENFDITVLDLLFGLIILLDAGLEIRAFKKWRA